MDWIRRKIKVDYACKNCTKIKINLEVQGLNNIFNKMERQSLELRGFGPLISDEDQRSLPSRYDFQFIYLLQYLNLASKSFIYNFL